MKRYLQITMASLGVYTFSVFSLLWLFLGVFLSTISLSSSYAASKITAIDFKGTDDPSEISIQSDGPLTYEKQENAQDKQVVLELKNATISKSNSRKIDTSSFNSNVALVSPYKVKGEPATVRVVIQLRQQGTAEVTQEGNTIKVKVPNANATASVPDSGANSSNVAEEQTSIQSSSSAPTAPLPVDTTPDASAQAKSDNKPDSKAEVSQESTAPKTKLDEFVESKENKKFTGSPITLQVRDVEVADVLRLIGEASGFNIIVGDGVRGRVTLSLVDVPWDQALDVVLHTLHLGAERSHNILRIVTLADLTAEKVEEFRATQAAEANAPRVTKVFPISYAELNDLAAILTKFASTAASGGGGAAGATGTSAGIVQVDARTNSLVIRDLPDQIERMKKLIELLDTQTPQVMIEAKVIEATEGFTKSLNGSLGLGPTTSPTGYFASFAGGNPIDGLVGTPGVFASGADISNRSSPSGGTPNGSFGLSPSLSFLPGSPRLNALLSWGESETQVKIVASPKTVVLNKQTANIVQGTPVLVPGTTTVAGVGTVATTTVQQANVSLKVKPTVTNDGAVLMDLTVTKDVPFPLPGGNQGIGSRNMQTLVLVDSGSTLVIGGIYSMQANHNSSGFPILRKIPILGALFGNETESTDRTELFIFITPRILNPREAGFSG